MDQKTIAGPHLTDAELFSLAVPAAGEPEALPSHLSGCQPCSRALQEWKATVRALAEEDLGPLSKRSPREWRAAEEATMSAVRQAGRPGRRPRPVRWALGIAATLALVGLLFSGRGPAPGAARVPAPADEAGLSAADRADDALLRDVAYLAQGGDTLTDPESDESL